MFAIFAEGFGRKRNISRTARVDVYRSFLSADIAGMLKNYEAGYHTEMNIREIADIIYDYLSR